MTGPALTSGMQTAAEQPTLALFMAIQLVLPASDILPATTVQLLDGSGVMAWDGMSFTGQDGNYGAWGGITDTLEKSLATAAPKFQTGFVGLSGQAIQQLCQPQTQGAPVNLFYGYFNIATGQPIANPITWFVGAVDVCHLKVSETQVSVDMDVVAASEFMLMNNEGARLNSAYHQLFFPGERGFAFVDNVTHQIPWAAAGPRPDQVTDASNFDNSPSPPKTTLSF